MLMPLALIVLANMSKVVNFRFGVHVKHANTPTVSKHEPTNTLIYDNLRLP